MWFSVALWTVLASLVCSTVAYSSSRHSGFPDYDSALPLHKPHFGKAADEDPWAPLARGIYGKTMSSAESSATDDTSLLSTLEDSEPDEPVNSSQRHEKRDGHSLSIVNPLDVLRQRLMLEMARRRMKENQEQIRENAVILKNLGKRGTNYLRRIQASNNEDFEV